MVPATGGDAKQLTTGAWDVTDYDWSPDSRRLVVAGNAEPEADLQRELNLYLVDLQANLLRLGGGFYLSSPIWSPKGDQIAFIAPAPDGFFQVYRLPISGGVPVIVTTDPSHKTQPAWSPDGSQIAFTVWSYEAQFWRRR